MKCLNIHNPLAASGTETLVAQWVSRMSPATEHFEIPAIGFACWLLA